MLWILLAILLVGGASAVVNDVWFDGRLFESATVVSVATLGAFLIYLGQGIFSRHDVRSWMYPALIWAAVAAVAGLGYFWLKA